MMLLFGFNFKKMGIMKPYEMQVCFVALKKKIIAVIAVTGCRFNSK